MDRFVARANDIVVEELDGGLVIYDGREAEAHWLDPTATAVWGACREPRTEAEIADAAGLDGPTCELVVSQLVDLGLVEVTPGSGYSRRVVLRTAAKVGMAGAVGAPIISAVVPAAAAALSAVPLQPSPPSPPQTPLPGLTTQTLSADQTLVPGAPGVSDVTVTVGTGKGNGSGAVKHRTAGFSVTRATVNRHGGIVLTLSGRDAGAFMARASFRAIDGSKKRPHLQGAYGSGSAILGKSGTVKLTISPTPAATKALAAKRPLAVSVTITFTPVAGAAGTLTATLTIS